ncbi:MAG: UvrD-helicase domain-containing protein [Planctomycetota bacterium]
MSSPPVAAQMAPDIVLASAGSGKTYQLSECFVALLAAGVPPERILATSFTRKAAGEILQRVLERLAKAADQDAAQRALLAALMRELQRFEVRTLDSVFVSLAGQLGSAVGLAPGWTLVNDSELKRLQGAAVDAVLAETEPHELLPLLENWRSGSSSRSVHESLVQAFSGRARELFRSTPSAVWGGLPLPEGLSPAQQAQAIQALGKVNLPVTKKGQPDKNFAAGVERVLELAGDLDSLEGAKAFLLNGLVGKVLLEEVTYCTHPIEADLAEPVTLLAQSASRRIVEDLVGRGRALHRLLALHEQRWSEVQRRRRCHEFSDFPRLLADASADLGGEQASFLRGTPTEHLLLDEFQDTSRDQWSVLAPLADRIAAGRRGAFFCVGDVKQAIYGWRGGDAELLASMPARYGVKARRLDQSYRSAPAVLAAVNRVFTSLPTNTVIEDLALKDSLPEWVREFQAHTSALEPRPSGSVRLVCVPVKGRGAAAEQALARCLAERVVRLREEEPGWRVGVLVRRNKRIPGLLRELQRAGVPATGAGGQVLTDSPAVTQIVSLLHLADHPGDTQAAYHVAKSPLGPALGLAVNLEGASRLARRVRADLLARGYGPTLELYAATLRAGAECGDWDRLRLPQLVELGHAFDARPSRRPADFVAHVRTQRVEVPAGMEVVVTTYHQAKGLEYDAVLLPELDAALIGRFDPLLVGRGPGGAPTFIVPAPVKDIIARLPSLREAREAERAKGLEAQLCGLYVAMTRAKRRLDLIVPEEPSDKSVAALLCAALSPPPQLSEATLFENDGSSVAAASAAPSESPLPSLPAAGAAVPHIALRRGGAVRVRTRRSPSTQTPAEGAAPAESSSSTESNSPGAAALGADPNAAHADTGVARARGVMLHAWFERLAWLDEGQPSEAQLLAAGRQCAVREGCDLALVPRWLREWRELLQEPVLQRALSRATQQGPAGTLPDLRSEAPFAYLEGNSAEAALVIGRIDRLVLWRRDGIVVAAEILDFKTGAGSGRAPEERAREHVEQMRAYCAAVAKRYALPAEAVTARLLFVDARPVADVSCT